MVVPIPQTYDLAINAGQFAFIGPRKVAEVLFMDAVKHAWQGTSFRSKTLPTFLLTSSQNWLRFVEGSSDCANSFSGRPLGPDPLPELLPLVLKTSAFYGLVNSIFQRSFF